MTNWEEFKNECFKPTFNSNYDFFKVRGYDEERDVLLTTIYFKDGSTSESEIEGTNFVNALGIGEYKAIGKKWADVAPNPIYEIVNPYASLSPQGALKEQVFNGLDCGRCIHRFGNTSMSKWCKTHCSTTKNCYRFKFKK